MNSLKKRTAPAPPPTIGSNSSGNATFYGTLPHPPRHSQNFDITSDLRSCQNHKNINSTNDSSTIGGNMSSGTATSYGTLPHLRSVEGSPRIPISGIGGQHNNIITATNTSHHGGFYERFEKIINQEGQMSGGGHHVTTTMTTFGHKRSPSGESLNRSLHLAGAKLVLPPATEIPPLKHVDKSALIRPKIPPPGPPLGINILQHYVLFNIKFHKCFTF